MMSNKKKRNDVKVEIKMMNGSFHKGMLNINVHVRLSDWVIGNKESHYRLYNSIPENSIKGVGTKTMIINKINVEYINEL